MSYRIAETRLTVPFPIEQVFDGLVATLEPAGFSIKARAKVIGRITATADASMTSWGENIAIDVQRTPDNRSTALVIQSRLKAGLSLFGGDKNARNIETIIAALSDYLERMPKVTGERAPSKAPSQPSVEFSTEIPAGRDQALEPPPLSDQGIRPMPKTPNRRTAATEQQPELASPENSAPWGPMQKVAAAGLGFLAVMVVIGFLRDTLNKQTSSSGPRCWTKDRIRNYETHPGGASIQFTQFDIIDLGGCNFRIVMTYIDPVDNTPLHDEFTGTYITGTSPGRTYR
jgi:hypothetical protein